MKDLVVIESCRRAGIDLSDMNNLLPLETMERKQRVLDKPPTRLDKFKYEEAYAYGCCNEIVMTYMKLKEEYPKDAPTYGTLEIGEVPRKCTLDTYFFLKSLVLSSLGVIPERATASFEIFVKITMATGDLTNTEVLRDLLVCDSSNYYQSEIIKAAKICLFGENPIVQYWESKTDYIGYYPNAMVYGRKIIDENCKDLKDVNRFVRDYSKKAREDKEFMKGLYRKAANKYLYAVMYYCKDKYPDVMNLGGANDGFAPIEYEANVTTVVNK